MTERLRNNDRVAAHGKELQVRTQFTIYNTELIVDFYPLEGGKRGGLEFAQEVLKIPPDSTVVAGDHGNDIEMLSG
jgi:hydroxymethylpyrimidine pyrophosphatase-like HAD family hydrolase